MQDVPPKRSLSLRWLAVAVLAGAAVAFFLIQFRHHNKLRLQLICGTRVKSLGSAARVYAVDRGQDLVATVQSMIDRGELAPEMAICPVSKKPFMFAPISTNDLESISPSDVVVYEPLSYHHGEGANMLFADGHASFIRANRYAGIVGKWATTNGE